MTERKRSILFHGGSAALYLLLSFTTTIDKAGLLFIYLAAMSIVPRIFNIKPTLGYKYRKPVGLIFMFLIIFYIVFWMER